MNPAHSLAESKVEIAKTGFGGLPASGAVVFVVPVVLVVMCGLRLMRVPYRMPERTVLRRQQQQNAKELQKGALHPYCDKSLRQKITA